MGAQFAISHQSSMVWAHHISQSLGPCPTLLDKTAFFYQDCQLIMELANQSSLLAELKQDMCKGQFFIQDLNHGLGTFTHCDHQGTVQPDGLTDCKKNHMCNDSYEKRGNINI
jgi:hypothetical protein